MGLKVKMEGAGTIKSQSVNKGIKVKRNQIIVLRT
jgi:cell division protein FtsI (penicillin-binding protein 3)